MATYLGYQFELCEEEVERNDPFPDGFCDYHVYWPSSERYVKASVQEPFTFDATIILAVLVPPLVLPVPRLWDDRRTEPVRDKSPPVV